ncbi:MAG: T9SS type A sorting domain-containing protein [Saprospiraceae bacterium]|nr:T9SS type A sorting domain-containing protein [Saprospiraceae bacterium]
MEHFHISQLTKYKISEMDFQKNLYQKMLPIALLGFVLAAKPALSQSKIDWNDSLVVRQTAHFITAPRVKILDDGTVVCVWGESSNPNQILCSRLENNQFSIPISVVITDPGPVLFGFGGFDVAVHGQTIFVVFERLGGGIFISRSDDGGQSFIPPFEVQGAVTGGFVTLANIAVDELGNIFVNYIHGKNGEVTQQIRRSVDGGQNFSIAVDASQPADGTAVCECCVADPVAYNGSVWLAFRNNNANIRDHWVSRSANLADTFDLATDVDNSDWQINFCPISGPRMALAKDSLFVVWKTGAYGGSKIFASSLHATTMDFGQQIRLGGPTQLSDNQNLPEITASGDTLGMVFQEDQSISFSFSTNGLMGLNVQNTYFKEDGQVLSYPSVAFQNGVFFLVYVNSTTQEIIYRQGFLLPSLGTPTAEMLPETVIVFPNPTNEEVQIYIPGYLEGASNWHVLSATGKVELSGVFSGETNLEKIVTIRLISGIYQLIISGSVGILHGKFIKN